MSSGKSMHDAMVCDDCLRRLKSGVEYSLEMVTLMNHQSSSLSCWSDELMGN